MGEWTPNNIMGLQITHKSAADHTPFSIAYGSEAVIPVELEVSSHRVTYYDPRTNRDLLLEFLNLVDEKLTWGQLHIDTESPDTVTLKSDL